MDKLAVQIMVNVVVVVLILGVFFRIQTNEIEELRGDMIKELLLINESLAMTQQVIFRQFTNLKADTELEVVSVRQHLSDSLKLVRDAIEDVQAESKRSIGSLEVQLTRVETTKEATLTKLQQELGTLTADVGDFSLLVDTAIQSVVRVKTPSQIGSGVIINEAGYIVTNHHVVADAVQITIELADKSIQQATLIGSDPEADIAILKIKGTYPALKFGDSNFIEVGDAAVSIGYPGGLDLAVSQGIIGATNRLGRNSVPVFQTDVAISPGSSGGPLIDRTGKIIGINVGIHFLNLLGYERFGFSIKSNHVTKVIRKIQPGLL